MAQQHKDAAVLMCKKIAQLTKVIYHLNTVNEDHAIEMDAVQKHHKKEVHEMLRDATSKLATLKDGLANKKDDANAKALVEQQKRKHEKEKAECLSKWKKELADSEAALHSEYGLKLATLGKEVTHVKSKFAVASETFEAAAKKLLTFRGHTERHLERSKSEHETALKDQERESRMKYESMVGKQQDVNDELRASIEQREKEVKRLAEAKALEETKVALGQLRAEMDGQRETQLAALKRSAAEEQRTALAKEQAALREQEQAAERLADVERNAAGAERELRVKNAEAAAELRDLRSKKTELEGRGVSMAEELVQLKKELDQLRANSSTLAEGGKQQIAELKKREADLQSEVDRARRVTSGVEAKLGEKTKQLEDATGTIEAMKRRVEKELAVKDSKIAEVEAQLRAARGESSSAHRDLDHLKAELEKQLKAKTASCIELEAKLQKSADSALVNDASYTSELAAKEQGWAKRLAEATARQAETSLAREKALMESERAFKEKSARSEIKLKGEAQAEANRAASELEKVRGRLQAEVDRLGKKSQNLEVQLEEASAKAADEGALRELRAEYSETEATLRKTTAVLGASQADARRSKEVSESLKDQVEELRQELESSALAAKQRLAREKSKLEEEWSVKLTEAVERSRKSLLADASEATQNNAMERDKLRRALELEAEKKLAAMQAQRDAALIKASETMDLLTREKHDRLEDAKRHSDDQAALRERLSSVEKQLANFEQSASESAQAATAQRTMLEDQLTKTTHELKVLQKAHESLEETSKRRVEDLEERLAVLESVVEEKRRGIEKSETVGEELREDLRRRKSDIVELNRLQAQTLKDDAEQLKRSMEQLEAEWQARHDSTTKAASEADAALNSELAERKAQFEAEISAALSQAEATLQEHRDEAEEREANLTASNESLVASVRLEHAEAMEVLSQKAQRRYDGMLEAFDADRQRHTIRITELEEATANWSRRYESRESRGEDLEVIRQLQADKQAMVVQLEANKAELAYFKRELINREENFNRKFNAAPNVGVMQVIKPKPTQSQSFSRRTSAFG